MLSPWKETTFPLISFLNCWHAIQAVSSCRRFMRVLLPYLATTTWRTGCSCALYTPLSRHLLSWLPGQGVNVLYLAVAQKSTTKADLLVLPDWISALWRDQLETCISFWANTGGVMSEALLGVEPCWKNWWGLYVYHTPAHSWQYYSGCLILYCLYLFHR